MTPYCPFQMYNSKVIFQNSLLCSWLNGFQMIPYLTSKFHPFVHHYCCLCAIGGRWM